MTGLRLPFRMRLPACLLCVLVLTPVSVLPVRAQDPAPSMPVTVSTGQPLSSIEFVRLALERNGELSAARLDAARARSRRRQAGLVPNPTLDFERRTGRFTGAKGESETSIGVAIPIEIAGQRGRRIDVAEAEMAAVEAEIANRERQLSNDVRVRYAEALAASRELSTLEDLNSIDTETVRFVGVRIAEGDSAPLDLRLLQTEVSRLQARRTLVEGRLRASLLELKNLAGLPADGDVKLGEDLALAVWSNAPRSIEEATAIAMTTRPDLRLAALEQTVAEAGLRLVRAQSAPELTAFGRYTVENSVFDETPVGVLTDRDRTLAFGVSIGIPIFNRNQGARAEAEIAIEQAKRRRAFAESRVRAEVASAFARLQAAESAVATFETGVIERSEANVASVRGAYLVGAFRITELLAEQRRLVESQREFTETLSERYRALADLQAAMGIEPVIGERSRPLPRAAVTTEANGYPGATEVAPDADDVEPLAPVQPLGTPNVTLPETARSAATGPRPE